MKTTPALLALFLCGISCVAADSLIVTTEGKGIRATAVSTNGDTVSYTDKETGEENKIAAGSVEAIIPFVRNGEQYAAARIQENVDLVKKLKPRHKELWRYLNQLQQEWEALQKPSRDFGQDIEKAVEAYMSGDKSTKAYKAASSALGMIGYKDAQGKYKAQMEAALEQVKTDYLTVNTARLTAFSTTNRISVDDFVYAKCLASDLGRSGDQALREKATGLLARAQLTAFDSNLREARAIFSGKKDIETFLQSRDLLCRIRKDVSASDEQTRKIDNCMAEQIGDMGRLLPSYSFTDGFPLGKDDQQTLAQVKAQSSRVKIGTATEDPECLVFPLKPVAGISPGKPFSLPLRLIFNRTQPANRVYEVAVLMAGETNGFSHNVRFEKIQVQNGRADITVKEDFANLDKTFKPAADKQGNSYLLLYLAYRYFDELKAGEQWAIMSLGCVFPLTK